MHVGLRLFRVAILCLAGTGVMMGCTPAQQGNNDANKPPSGGDGGGNATCTTGLGPWTGKDNVEASAQPPCGLAPDKVPMFVSIGWDDNSKADGVNWASKIHLDRQAKTTFFLTSTYGSDAAVKKAWLDAYKAGNEIGNHTVSHLPSHGGRQFSASQWDTEIAGCTTFLTTMSPALPEKEIYGFRTPYLEYNKNTLTIVKQKGFRFDCSVEEGYEDGQTGSDYFWPYTLDKGSPGHTVQVGWGKDTPNDPSDDLEELDPVPGLWEMPVYALLVPPDDKCEEFGVPKGLRQLLRKRQEDILRDEAWFDPADGKITGFDYNLWAPINMGGFAMTRAEFVATLKYSLSLRLEGNRAPFLFGAHPDYYVESWSTNAPGAMSVADRRGAVEDFLDYAVSKGAVVTTYKDILDWVRNPKPR